MDKSPDAFRTISEVADVLDTPAHVLRFWESRFPQIRPVKRAGGRRYYRPSDVALLSGIKRLLHDEGLTIRGVQKILREQGVRHVAGLTGDEVAQSESDAEAALDAALAENFLRLEDEAEPAPESAVVVSLDTLRPRSDMPTMVDTPSLFDAVAGDDAAGSAAAQTLADRLRALPAGALNRRRAEALALRDRLLALQARLGRNG